MHQCKGRVVADRADVAKMIGEPFEFSHQGAQICGARRNSDVEGRLDRLREGETIGDGAVAGNTRRDLRSALDRGASHQLVDALVHEAEPLLEAHDGFAIRGEAEMTRLDNAGVDGPDRYQVERLALGGQKRVWVADGIDLMARAAGLPNPPATMIEPTAMVGRAFGL